MVITAGAPEEPESLLNQLAENGCMVVPIGSSYSQQMTVISRSGTEFKKEVFHQFSFVPLIGKEGWNDTVF